MFKLKLKKYKNFGTKLVKFLSERTFFAFLILLFFALVFGGIIFYQYKNLAEAPVEIGKGYKPLEFNEDAYQKILTEWQERSYIFSLTETKDYPNPFKVKVSTTTEELTE